MFVKVQMGKMMSVANVNRWLYGIIILSALLYRKNEMHSYHHELHILCYEQGEEKKNGEIRRVDWWMNSASDYAE